MSLPTEVVQATTEYLQNGKSIADIQEYIHRRYGYGLPYIVIDECAELHGIKLPSPPEPSDDGTEDNGSQHSDIVESIEIAKLPRNGMQVAREEYNLVRNALSCGETILDIQEEVQRNFHSYFPLQWILEVAELEGFFPAVEDIKNLEDMASNSTQSESSDDTDSSSSAGSTETIKILEDRKRGDEMVKLRRNIFQAQQAKRAILSDGERSREAKQHQQQVKQKVVVSTPPRQTTSSGMLITPPATTTPRKRLSTPPPSQGRYNLRHGRRRRAADVSPPPTPSSPLVTTTTTQQDEDPPMIDHRHLPKQSGKGRGGRRGNKF